MCGHVSPSSSVASGNEELGTTSSIAKPGLAGGDLSGGATGSEARRAAVFPLFIAG